MPRLAVAAAATALVLVPAFAERWSYYGDNATWMRLTKVALDADTDAKTVMDALRAEPPGRAYAGLRANWGQMLTFGLPFNSVRMSNLLVFNRIDAVAAPYRSASLNSDLMWDFNDQDPAMYRLFNVDYVIAPASVQLPPTLRPLVSTPRYVLYASPGRGYAEYAAIVGTETPTSQLDLFERARAWIRGGEASNWDFARYAYLESGSVQLETPIADCRTAQISYERVQPGRFDLLASCPADSAMVLKVSYHPNWHVMVDGHDVATFMASPSYLGFALPAGQHFIAAEYRSSPLKTPLFLLGLGALLSALGYEWRSFLRGRLAQLLRWSQSRRVGRTMLHQSTTLRILE